MNFCIIYHFSFLISFIISKPHSELLYLESLQSVSEPHHHILSCFLPSFLAPSDSFELSLSSESSGRAVSTSESKLLQLLRPYTGRNGRAASSATKNGS